MLIDKAAEMGKKEVVNAKGQIVDQKGFNDALFALMNDRFKGGMEIQSKSFNGMISNLKDSMATTARVLSQPLFDKLKAGITNILPLFGAVQQAVGGDMIGAIGTLTKAFGPEKGLIISKFFVGIRDGVQEAKNYIKSFQPAVNNIGKIFNNLLPIFKTVGAGIVVVFVGIKNALPPIINGLTSVVAKITAWKGFIPVVAGVVAAFVTFRATMATIRTAQAAWLAVTKAATLAMNIQRAATMAYMAAGGGLRGVMRALQVAQRTLNLTMLGNPIVLVVAALVGLGVALVVAYKKSETFRNIVNGAWKAIKDGFAATIKWFTTTLPAWVLGVVRRFDEMDKNARNKVRSLRDGVINFFIGLYQGVAKWAKNLYSSVASWFSNLYNKGKSIWNSLKSTTVSIFASLVSGVVSFLNSLYNNGKRILTNLKTYFANIGKIIKGVFTGDFGAIKSGVLGIMNLLWSGIRNVLSKLGINVDGAVSKIKNFFVNGWNTIKDKTTSIFGTMWTTIKGKIGDIATAAGDLPGKIGSAIKKKVKDATDAMKDLGKALIKRFEEALGIDSPSKEFYAMAGWIVKGLVNGLNAENLKDLGTKTFKGFADGAFNTISSIKDWIKGGFSLGKGAGGDIGNWIKQAMALTKTPMSWLGGLTTIAKHESGGNPRAVNNWDSNAKKGTPSMGLMQTILPTFQAYAKKGFGNVMNPVHNAIAAINYIKDRYGNIFNVPGIKSMLKGGKYKGYEFGGFSLKKQLAWLSENNQPEAIVPLVGKRMDPFAVAVASKLDSLFGSAGSNQGGITVHTEFHQSEPLPPSEIKRKQLQLARQLAYEWGIGG